MLFQFAEDCLYIDMKHQVPKKAIFIIFLDCHSYISLALLLSTPSDKVTKKTTLNNIEILLCFNFLHIFYGLTIFIFPLSLLCVLIYLLLMHLVVYSCYIFGFIVSPQKLLCSITIVHKRVLNYHICRWKEQNNYAGEK